MHSAGATRSFLVALKKQIVMGCEDAKRGLLHSAHHIRLAKVSLSHAQSSLDWVIA